MAETERERTERLNRNVARRQALDRVSDAIRAGFTDPGMIVGFLGLAKESDILLALKVNLIEQVDNKLALIGTVTEAMWREAEPTEAPVIKLIAPVLPGCKCQNSDQSSPPYWFYTGNELDIRANAEQLHELGITVIPQANGKNGNYKLLLPTWVEGNLILGAQPTWKDITEKGEEKDHVNSINSSNSNAETRDTATESVCLLGQIQREANPSLAQRS